MLQNFELLLSISRAFLRQLSSLDQDIWVERLARHRLLAALVEAEIPVCAPLPFPDGETLQTDGDLHHAIWPRTGGRSPDELSDDQLGVLGRLMARIHAVAADLGAPHRRPLDPEHGPLEALALLEDGDWLPPSCRARYVRAVEGLVESHKERIHAP